MRKYVLLIMAVLMSLTLNAQCLGDDCSIKGRNRETRRKVAKMTGSKGGGRSYSGKPMKRGKSKGFDPFAKSGKRKKGAGGFDPFATNAKSKKKKGGGYDPFASNSKRKGSSKSGYDPFGKSKGKKGIASGGYSGWDSGKRPKAKGGGTANWDGSKTKKAKAGGGYANWDGGKTKSAKAGGGIWADGSSSKRSSHRRPKQSGGGSDWSQNNFAGMAPPSYSRQDNIPRSFSDFESSSVSSDITYKRPHRFKFELIGGGIIKHDKKAKEYLNNTSLLPVMGATFALEYPTTGAKNWHHYFNLPAYGFALTYMYLGNAHKLGHSVALYPYIDIPLIRSKHVDFNFSNGFGVAYVSKYDRSKPSNPDIQTPLIGSPVNMFIKSGLSVDIRPIVEISSERKARQARYTLHAGISWMHLSNGSFSSPNSGINILGGEIGVKFAPEIPETVLRQKAERLPRYFTIDFMGTAGVRECDHLNTKKYFIGNLNATAYFQAASIYRIGLGVDGFYDGVFTDKQPGRYPNVNYDPDYAFSPVRAGICLSNEFVLGRTTAAIDGGVYLFDPIKARGEKPLYFRFALKYRFTNGFFGALTVKTHNFTAEYVSLGVGYSILL